MSERDSAGQIENAHRNRGVGSHEILNDGLFELNRPWNRDEKEKDGKCEKTDPRLPARQIKDPKRNDDGDNGEAPTDQAPVRIRDSDNAQRQQHDGGSDRQGDYPGSLLWESDIGADQPPVTKSIQGE